MDLNLVQPARRPHVFGALDLAGRCRLAMKGLEWAFPSEVHGQIGYLGMADYCECNSNVSCYFAGYRGRDGM